MAAANWLRYAYLAHIAKPKADRELYRRIKSHAACRIVEVGIGDLDRATRLIAVAQRFAGDQKVFYTGLDWFDARPAEAQQLTLKQAHRRLQATGAQIRLVPGPPGQMLASVANAHQNTDLLVISHAIDEADLTRSWFYVPRMLRAESHVMRQYLDTAGEHSYTRLSASELAERAALNAPRRAA